MPGALAVVAMLPPESFERHGMEMLDHGSRRVGQPSALRLEREEAGHVSGAGPQGVESRFSGLNKLMDGLQVEMDDKPWHG